MKRIIAILFIAILSVSMIGCSGGTGSSVGSGTNTDNAASGVTEDKNTDNDNPTVEEAGLTDDNTEGSTAEDTETADDVPEKDPVLFTDYIQEQVTIGEIDKYKVSVTGYDPAYEEDGLKGFLINFSIENKSDKDYQYYLFNCAVNHVPAWGDQIDKDVTAAPGESVQIRYMISSDILETYGISAVDALGIYIETASSEYLQAEGMEVFELAETDRSLDHYTFSPTGKDYEQVPPAAEITDDKYDIVANDDLLTFGFRKNTDGSIVDKDGIYFGMKTNLENPDECDVQITDIKVDGKELYEMDSDGEVYEDDEYSVPLGGFIANEVYPSAMFVDEQYVEKYDIKNASEISFTIDIIDYSNYSIEDFEGAESVYHETFSYNLKK